MKVDDHTFQSMMLHFHEQIYEHLTHCGMIQTAKIFVEESQFYPTPKSTITASQTILSDDLLRTWSSEWLDKQMDSIPKVLKKLLNSHESEESKSMESSTSRKQQNEKPFVCPHCDKSFMRKYDMKVHMRIHTNERPYACHYAGCNKTFNRVSTLKEHERNIHQKRRTEEEEETDSNRSTSGSPPHKQQRREEKHNHGVIQGAFNLNGNTYILHEGHADILGPDHTLQHVHKDSVDAHVLAETSENPIRCQPVNCKGPHAESHRIRHGDHVDYIVDNMLHHVHEEDGAAHCDHHGPLVMLDYNSAEWEELVRCLDCCPPTT
ncbi:hypothetical protein PROFUN_12113 [Planoprotostelium fungivorum]|uniref:C2H2-type domain-containing protein n=1 Tax=Planoprotostelium fungivorum TaxID=1890364 RepID=A0A2P6N8E1_9EUKA|nr:hypothetical protein PROFUN_12113 [Planoprotostelium fungivorum]